MFAGSNNPAGRLNSMLMIIGAVLLAWGLQKLSEVGNPTDIEIEAQVDTIYQQELHRMEQAQVNELAKLKDEADTMSPEEKALILMRASQPIQLTAEQEDKHRKAIRSEITQSIEHRRKKAASLAFAGGALLFLMLSPIFSNWVSDKILRKIGDKP